MTDAELAARLRANIVAYKQFQTAQGGLRHLGLPGVWAFAQPSHPATVSQQQVFFDDTEALEAAVPRFEDFYRSHGVRLWRVPLPPGAPASLERALASAGYHPEEGGTTAMGICLADTPVVPPSIPLEDLRTQEELIPLNEEAFGPGTSIHLEPWHSQSFPQLHIRGVREGGRLLSGGLTHEQGDTAGVYLVATAHAARGRGLASELMRGLFLEARARGCTAAVLQSTELGYGVYQRVGMRDLGTWVNWVRRAG
ncbi:GNAT family N-acetyltransferase [Hyalangium versicolor]|uniref:GNAT family N-acetyltransferase n=1 Tax=Hyalangium versicolor TaxID=2861190 RepID=UPI001CCBCDB4|nr:GNAT family N-acetyltransferase [Hyalangium versicolor]